jgi:hypothetical protein
MSKRALCIGVNNYPGTHMDLSGCVNDANDWAAELATRGFAVSKLIDSQATKAAMVSGIQSLIAAAVSGDVVVITFSGHGTYVPDTNGDEIDGLDEALCPFFHLAPPFAWRGASTIRSVHAPLRNRSNRPSGPE